MLFFFSIFSLSVIFCGSHRFHETIGGYEDDFCFDVVTDFNENIYTIGHTKSFGSDTKENCWITKLHPNGSISWSVVYESYSPNTASAQEFAYRGDISVNGDLVVAGIRDHGDVYITLSKFSSTNGSLLWSIAYLYPGGGFYEEHVGVLVDPETDNVVFFTDEYEGSYVKFLMMLFSSNGTHIRTGSIGYEWKDVEYKNVRKSHNGDGFIITSRSDKEDSGRYDHVVAKLNFNLTIQYYIHFGKKNFHDNLLRFHSLEDENGDIFFASTFWTGSKNCILVYAFHFDEYFNLTLKFSKMYCHNTVTTITPKEIVNTPTSYVFFGLLQMVGGPILSISKNTGELFSAAIVEGMSYFRAAKLSNFTGGSIVAITQGSSVFGQKEVCKIISLDDSFKTCNSEDMFNSISVTDVTDYFTPGYGIVEDAVVLNISRTVIPLNYSVIIHPVLNFNLTCWTCNDINHDNPLVCSDFGECDDWDTCNCDVGYTGSNCELKTCFNVSESDLGDVCLGNGVCTDVDTCNCFEDYSGVNCNQWNCTEIPHDTTDINSTICSSRGNCTSPDLCTCEGGYEGADCSTWSCFGISHTGETSCTGRGNCISPDKCICSNSNSANLKYVGVECDVRVGTNLIRAIDRVLVIFFEVQKVQLLSNYNITVNTPFECSKFIEIIPEEDNGIGSLIDGSCEVSDSEELSSSFSHVNLLKIRLSSSSSLKKIIKKKKSLVINVLGTPVEFILLPTYESYYKSPKKLTKRTFGQISLSSSSSSQQQQPVLDFQKCKENLFIDSQCIETYECYPSLSKSNKFSYYVSGYIPSLDDTSSSYHLSMFYYTSKEDCENGIKFSNGYKIYSTTSCIGTSNDDNFVIYERCSQEFSFLFFQTAVLSYFLSTISPFFLAIGCCGCCICWCFINFLIFWNRKIFRKTVLFKNNSKEENKELLSSSSSSSSQNSDELEHVEEENDDDNNMIDNILEEEEEEEEELEGGDEISSSSSSSSDKDLYLSNKKEDNSFEIIHQHQQQSTKKNEKKEYNDLNKTMVINPKEEEEEDDERKIICSPFYIRKFKSILENIEFLKQKKDEEEEIENNNNEEKKKEEEEENIINHHHHQYEINNSSIVVEEEEKNKNLSDEYITLETSLQEFIEEVENGRIKILLTTGQNNNIKTSVDFIVSSSKNNKTTKSFIIKWLYCCFCCCFCCCCNNPIICGFLKTFSMLFFILVKEGFYLYFASAEFFNDSGIDSSNDYYILLTTMMRFNQIIIGVSISMYLLIMFFLIIFCMFGSHCSRCRFHNFCDPLQFCILYGYTKELVIYRFFKSLSLLWFICLNLFCFVVKFAYLDSFEQKNLIYNSTTDAFWFWLSLILPISLLINNLIDVLQYNGVSSHKMVNKLNSNLIKFPRVNIGFLKTTKDLDVILEEIFQLIFLMDRSNSSKEKLEKYKNSYDFGHMSWEYLDGLSFSQILFLRDFFFDDNEEEKEIQKENYMSIFSHHRVCSKKWIFVFCFFPVLCWFSY